MPRTSHASRPDLNKATIVSALRAIGASVTNLAGGQGVLRFASRVRGRRTPYLRSRHGRANGLESRARAIGTAAWRGQVVHLSGLTADAFAVRRYPSFRVLEYAEKRKWSLAADARDPSLEIRLRALEARNHDNSEPHVLPQVSDGLSSPSQLNLATAIGLVRPRRERTERTDADKAWHSEQVKVQIQNANYREVYRQLAFLAEAATLAGCASRLIRLSLTRRGPMRRPSPPKPCSGPSSTFWTKDSSGAYP